MRKLILILAGCLAAGSVQAADLPGYYAPVALTFQPAAIVSDAGSATIWSSYFVGASASLEAVDPFALGAEVFAGVTATSGDFLYGGVLSAGLLSGGGASVELASRFGVVVSPQVAAFGIIGSGYETRYEGTYLAVGAGVSVAVAPDMTVDATLKARRLNGAPDGEEWRLAGTVGVAFHF